MHLGPEISNRKNDPKMTEVGRGFVGPLLIKAYRSHDGVDRQNGEQDPFIESVQTPFLKGRLRREAQRRCQARQQKCDRSQQSEDPSRAVCPFRIFPALILVVDEPFVLQTSEFFEQRLTFFASLTFTQRPVNTLSV